MTAIQIFTSPLYSYVGQNFKEWFGSMPFNRKKKVKPLVGVKLNRAMNDKEILEELEPYPVSLEEIHATIQTLDHSEWAIFYVKDRDGVLRTVDVYWDSGGWCVNANPVADPRDWIDGNFDIICVRMWKAGSGHIAGKTYKFKLKIKP